MDTVQELVWALNEEGQKQFRKYLQHKSNRINRKDLDVFNVLCRPEKIDPSKSIKKLYGIVTKENTKAYNLIRVRLKKQLENFYLQQGDDLDSALQISRLTNIARKLYFQKKYEASWKYLEEAEGVAMKAEEYELLNQIYHYMIEYAWTQESDQLRAIIQKNQENKENVQIANSLNLAFSLIRNQLNESHRKGKKPDLDLIIKNALKEFNVHETTSSKASHKYKVAMIVKISFEEKNDYESLYKYFIKTLEEMERESLFNKYNYHYKIEMLNAICYSSIKAGNYASSEKYIHLLEEENKNYPETDLLSIQSFVAKIVILIMTKRLNEAMEVLIYLKNKYHRLYSYDDYLFLMINYNSASINLELGKANKARSDLNELLKYQKRILRYWGMEALFYCHSIECLLAIETNDFEYAQYRIQSMERKFKELLQQEESERNKKFLGLLRKISKNETIWKDPEFKKEAIEFIKIKPEYKPSTEFISFNAWLFSRIENVRYSEQGYNEALKIWS